MKTCLLAAALLAACGTAHADATLRYEGATESCRTDFDVILVAGSRIRIDGSIIPEMDTSAIYDGLEQMLIGLDHGEKTFTQMELDDDAQDFQGDVAKSMGTRTRIELGKAEEAIAAAKAQYEAQCKASNRPCPPMPQFDMLADAMAGNVDTDALLAMQEANLARMDPKMMERAGIDREAMQKQLRESREQAAAIERERSAVSTPTGRTRTVAGVECTLIEKRIGELVVETRCEAEPAAIPLDERDAKGFQRGVARLTMMADTWRPLGEQVAGEAMPEEQKGIVIEKTCFDERGEETARAVLSIEKGGVDAAAFDIPSNYKPATFGATAEDVE